eukprot:scpid83733/ scgid21645/ Hemicentin-1; Fibulin-6
MDLPRRHLCVVVLVIAVWPGLLVAASSSGWTACGAIGGKQLEMKLFTDEKNFADSQNHCAQLGGNLSTVQTDVERKCADSAITTCAACNTVTDYGCGRTCRIWVGLEKTTAGWKWLTHATSLSTSQLTWRSGEPTDDDDQKCGYQYKEFAGLGDYPCNKELDYLCQRYDPGGQSLADGKWSAWTSTEACSVSCGGGQQTRVRYCTNPTPANGGQKCNGEHKKSFTCQTNSCPINGQWSSWSPFSYCKQTCGGVQTRTRTCTSPAPDHGGIPCTGLSTDARNCVPLHCPIDGGWSSWSPYTTCSRTCQGKQRRTRSCTRPSPAYNGTTCSGKGSENRACGVTDCPVNGNWSAWSLYSTCSATCEGTKTRTRSCTNPAPAHKGAGCQGSSQDNATCGKAQCPIDGKWSNWSPYGQCNATCEGTHVRTRPCNSPVQA